MAYHKKSDIVKTDIITPIHVGRKGAKNNLDYEWLVENMIGDDTGENISLKNPHFCELTALYWAWKNLKVDYLEIVKQKLKMLKEYIIGKKYIIVLIHI